MRSATKGILFAVVGATLLHGSGSAQDVGKVARIAEKSGDVPETRLAQIWRSADLRRLVRREDALLDRDIVRLRDRITLELLFRRPDLVSNAFLQPLSSVGGYEIRSGGLDTLGALQLVVKQGLMVVQHGRGKLLVLANGISTEILSTTVLFEVDSVAKTGTVFLQEGHIRFPVYGIDRTGNNLAWRLTPDGPREIIPRGNELKQWRHEVRYATHSVWHRTPFLQSAKFLVPAAILAVGGVVCIATECLGRGGGIPPPGTSRGGIDITIP